MPAFPRFGARPLSQSGTAGGPWGCVDRAEWLAERSRSQGNLAGNLAKPRLDPLGANGISAFQRPFLGL